MEKIPQIEGLDISVYYEPASTVGGDFYYITRCEKGNVGFIIGDVSGKGLVSALFLVRFTRTFEKLSVCDGSLAEAIEKANRKLIEETNNRAFVTMVFLVFDPHDTALYYMNAGHPPPLIWNNHTKRFKWLKRASIPPLGVSSEVKTSLEKVQLYPGDCVVLYTDGILETRDSQKNVYGLQRVESLVKQGSSRATEVVKRIVQDFTSFVKDTSYQDDFTVLSFSVNK